MVSILVVPVFVLNVDEKFMEIFFPDPVILAPERTEANEPQENIRDPDAIDPVNLLNASQSSIISVKKNPLIES